MFVNPARLERFFIGHDHEIRSPVPPLRYRGIGEASGYYPGATAVRDACSALDAAYAGSVRKRSMRLRVSSTMYEACLKMWRGIDLHIQAGRIASRDMEAQIQQIYQTTI